MVKKQADNGTFYHEPPFTPEEERELYRRMGPPITVVRQNPEPKQKSQPQEPEA